MLLPRTITSGTKTCAAAGTAYPLVTGDIECKSIYIEALDTNTDRIYWGDVNVTTTYPFLNAYDWRCIPFYNATKFYIRSVVNDEGVRYAVLI